MKPVNFLIWHLLALAVAASVGCDGIHLTVPFYAMAGANYRF